ncbi:MAG: DapH/DapD/GlmU-related protein [Pseudomonadota bacterium]
MKRFLLKLWMVESNIRGSMRLSTWFHTKVPVIGRYLAMIVDRSLLKRYGLEVTSYRVKVRQLQASHPSGVLLGGNGIVSDGRVAVMSGVKFVGPSPDNPEYLARHKSGDVFRLGDNVVIGANSVVVGPVDICDNVVIGAMSLVNRSITEPGTYVGIPAKRIKEDVPSDIWVARSGLTQ